MQRAAITRRAMMAGTLGALTAASLPYGALAAQKRGGILRISYGFQPTSLDPTFGRQGGDFGFLYPVFETLVDWEPQSLQPKPGLASSWAFPDPKTLVMKLREDVIFHDGTPFDGAAAKFNLDRGLNDAKSSVKADLASVESVEASGKHELTFHLKRPNIALPGVLSDRAGLMASPAAMEKFGDGFARNPIGTGPWAFVQWRDNEFVSYRRNDYYRIKGLPYLDGIDFHIIADANTGLRSVIAGENDFVQSLSTAQKPVVDKSGLAYTFSTSQAMFPLWLNYAKGPLADLRVRQALNYAIDREAYNKATALGLNEIAWGVFPKAHWAYSAGVDKAYAYNPEKAKQLLAAAGFANGLDLTMTGPNDQRSTQRQEVVMEQLKAVGVRIKLTALSVNDSIKAFFYDKQHDMLLILWGGRADPSATYDALFSKASPFNASGVEVGGLGDALAASQAVPDLKQRTGALGKVAQIVSDQALMVPLAFDGQYNAFTKAVNGFEPNLFGRMRLDTVSLES
jgi:peptide/nickel transport system permease protein/peptide/nickel transport system substrate-binding protein